MAIKFPPALNFTHRNTPIYPLKKLSKTFPGKNIWIKRDDFTGIELSGNKVRKLDFLLADALHNSADHVITCGGVQSNHCRATAYMAVKTGIQCTLFLRGKPVGPPTGNLLLDYLAGVHIRWVTEEEYQDIDQRMADYGQVLQKQGETPYIIPEGGSNAIGSWGYISCYSEILQQMKAERLHFDVVVTATGSGGTHAGLLFGEKIFAGNLPVLSVNVCDNAEFFRDKILRIAAEFEQQFKLSLQLKRSDIQIIDGFVGEGYGKINEAVRSEITRFAQEEGIILDPVYSAKAYLGLKSLLSENKIPYDNILFIHTGGIFGIFPAVQDLNLAQQ